MPTPAFWRQWHRWIGAPAALFVAYASVTGVLVAGSEFFGEEEALREANRGLVSAVRTDTPIGEWSDALTAALADAATRAAAAPIDKISVEFKGESPRLMIFTAKPGGGEDQRLEYNARSGAFVRAEAYADKPLLHRIHSAEFFGDGGLVMSMLWGTVLFALTVSGFLLYWRLFKVKRADRVGLRRFFF